MHSGLIFDIKRFALHDGPGIRTTIFLKGCFLQCPWCHNPEGIKPYPELFFRRSYCLRDCEECVKACPLSLDPHKDLFKIQEIHCIEKCGRCVSVCPTEALVVVGKEMRIEELLQEVLRDFQFYRVSGGGVTLSGGEPLFNASFSLALLQVLKSKGLHVAVETCCYGDPDIFKTLIEHVDLVIADIKFGNASDYEKIAHAKDGKIIFSNLKTLLLSKVPKIIRVPYIPGYTETIDNIKAIGHFLAKIKTEGLQRIELLPYNPLGESKYYALGLHPPIIPRTYRSSPLEAAQILNEIGFPAFVKGKGGL